MRVRRRSRRGPTRGAILLTAVLFLAIALFGTVHPPARLALAPLAASAGVAAVFLGRRRLTLRGLSGAAAVVLACAALASGLALLPVGPDGRAALQPTLGPVLEETLALADVARRPLALDPRAALLGWAWALACVTFGAGAFAVARYRAPRRALGAALLAFGVAVAFLGIVQQALGADAVYWATGVGRGLAFFGPFVHPNHAALLLAACIPLGVTRFFAEGRAARPWVAAATAIVAVGVVSSGSRGGPLVAALGVGLVAILGGPRKTRWLTAGLLAVCAVGVLALGPIRVVEAYTRWIEPSFAVDDWSAGRLALWPAALRLLAGAPWAGVGFGGFADAVEVVKRDDAFVTFTHAHQDWLQTGIEQGVPVLVLWLAGGALLAAASLRRLGALDRERRWEVVGWLSFLAVIALGATFDFPIRSGAVALATALAAGAALAADPGSARAGPGQRRAVLGAAALGAAVVGGSALALLAARSSPGPWGSADVSLARAEAALAAGDVGAAADGYRRALGQRPLDLDAVLGLARAAHALGDQEEALALLEVAQRVHPTHPSPWLAEARIHRLRGDDAAARSAYRRVLAVGLQPTLLRTALEEAFGAVADAGEAGEVLPRSPERQCEGARLLARRGWRDAAENRFSFGSEASEACTVAWAEELVLSWRAADRAVALLDPLPESCGRARITGLALVQEEQYEAALPVLEQAMRICGHKDTTLRTTLGRARLAAGDPAGVAILEGVLEDHPRSSWTRRELIRHYVGRGAPERALPHLRTLEVQGLASEEDLTLLERLESR